MDAKQLLPRAQLFFLEAEVKDENEAMDIQVAVNVNVDFDKKSALRLKDNEDESDRKYGRFLLMCDKCH